MRLAWQTFANCCMDWLVRVEFHALHRTWAAFQVCGGAGLFSALTLGLALTARGRLNIAVFFGVAVLAMLTFLAVAMATRIAIGEEKLIYHHHEAAVLAASALLLTLLRQPVLPYLDVTILSVGMFLGWGRVGCLMAGCCHGRPCEWGVGYGAPHAIAGFTHYYVGFRLFPVQAVESLWVLAVVIVGSVQVWKGAPAGTALAWYVVAYNIGRFAIEFCRGDGVRPYLWVYSEAQWTALVLLWAVVWAEWRGALPFDWRHATVAPLLTVIMIAGGFRLARSSRYRLLRPDHVRELSAVVETPPDPADRIRPLLTSAGVLISQGRIARGGKTLVHYAVSSRRGGMTEATAQTLAQTITRMKRASGPYELVPGERGVFHVLLPPTEGGR